MRLTYSTSIFTRQFAGVAAVLVVVLSMMIIADRATADLTVCSAGAGAGQCSNPAGVATDFETRRLYVADRGNNRIDVFEVDEGEGKVKFLFAFGWGVDTGALTFEQCTTASGCQAGISGAGNGQFKSPGGVAVDNDPLSSAFHDVYVYDSGNLRVQRFHLDGEFVKAKGPFSSGDAQVAVQGGTLYLGDSVNFDEKILIRRLNSDLEPLGECQLPNIQSHMLLVAFAVNSSANIFLGIDGDGTVRKFDSGCAQIGVSEPNANALGVDAADNLYAVQGIFGAKPATAFRTLTRYTPAGVVARRYAFGFASNTVPGVAPLATSLGDVFTSEQGASGSVKYLTEPPPGPVIASLNADSGNVRATIEAEIDPENKATEYRIDYVDDAHFKSEGGFASPKTKSTPLTPLPGAADFKLHLGSTLAGCETASKEAIENETCLTPETLYHYRVEASNADGKGNSPSEGTFTTKKPIEVKEVFASEVGVDSARLNATVDPLGIPATGYFEYVTETAYQEDKGEGGDGFADATQVPNVGQGAGELSFGFGEGPATRGVSVPLEPGTAYRFRLVATNPTLDVPRLSEAASFTTLRPEAAETCTANEAFRIGPAALLPDCRGYEMVSPLDKEGGDIAVLGSSAAGFPNALTQSSLAGDKLVYGSYRAFGDAEAGTFTAQYLASRSSTGWRSHYILGPRERLTIQGSLALITELGALSPDLCQAWFKAVAEPRLAPAAVAGQPNLYRRSDQECGTESYEAVSTAPAPHGLINGFELQGTSADGSKAIYMAPDNLTPDAPDLNGDDLALYYQEQGEGQPRYVCYGLDGKPIKTTCGAGTVNDDFGGWRRTSSLTGAISDDGQRVFFSTPALIFGNSPGKIFLRERPGQAQSTIAGGKCAQPAKACTIAVSAKGEELSKTTSSQFWLASADGSKALYSTGSDLYEFDVETQATTLIAHQSRGVLGASEDASRIYFASGEALTAEPNSEGDEPQAGKANLYLRDGGSLRFVGTLAESDTGPGIAGAGAIDSKPSQRRSRVSSDGLHVAFVSRAPLTGYDNVDAASGEAVLEVFLYDASANEGQGKLLCASCNPSGGRPTGQRRRVVGGTNPMAAWLEPWKTSLYPGRVMSGDGTRLYFEAADSLTPRDSNGAVDVYQWEELGSGGCDEADSSYSTQNEGCITLISSGQSSGDSALVDISPSGNDVFFTTAQGLVEEDYGLVDVYDARVGGGLPSPPKPAPECEGEACQAPAQAPSDPTPSSAGFKGAGNVVEGGAKPRCRKGQRRVRRAGKTRCVRSKRHRRAESGGRAKR